MFRAKENCRWQFKFARTHLASLRASTNSLCGNSGKRATGPPSISTCYRDGTPTHADLTCHAVELLTIGPPRPPSTSEHSQKCASLVRFQCGFGKPFPSREMTANEPTIFRSARPISANTARLPIPSLRLVWVRHGVVFGEVRWLMCPSSLCAVAV